MNLILTTGAILLISAAAVAQDSPTANTAPPPDLSFAPQYLHVAPNFLPGPGTRSITEAALRHQIEAIEAGGPDYAAMTPKIAEVLRSQVGQILPPLAQQWGPLQSLKFKYPTPGGDVFEARFEHARVRWAIVWSTAQKKISAIAFKTLAQWES